MRLVVRAITALIASTVKAVEAISFFRMINSVEKIATTIVDRCGFARPARISHLSRAELSRALSSGCPICVLEAEAVDRFAFWFLSEYYGEAAWVDRLVRSAGFCRHHTWLLVAHHAPYRLSYVALYLAKSLLQRPPDQWQSPAPCPLCHQLETTKGWWCRDLARLLLEPNFARQYERSQGVCPAHLHLVYSQASEPGRKLLLRLASISPDAVAGGPGHGRS